MPSAEWSSFASICGGRWEEGSESVWRPSIPQSASCNTDRDRCPFTYKASWGNVLILPSTQANSHTFPQAPIPSHTSTHPPTSPTPILTPPHFPHLYPPFRTSHSQQDSTKTGTFMDTSIHSLRQTLAPNPPTHIHTLQHSLLPTTSTPPTLFSTHQPALPHTTFLTGIIIIYIHRACQFTKAGGWMRGKGGGEGPWDPSTTH